MGRKPKAKTEEKGKEVLSGKKKALAEAIKQIEEDYGKGSIMKLGDTPNVNVEAIPTGALTLDMALGCGGVPRGRVIEVFGPESSGKSTLALNIVAECQKKGGICAYVDAENALDPEYAMRIGVNVKELLISQPDTGEQGLDIVEKLVRSNSVDIIVVDSVAALVPRAEIEGDMGATHMGLQARLMSQAMRKLTNIANKSKSVVLFINQIREKIGIKFGSPETTPGGRALKFYASVRIDIRRKEKIEQKTGDTKQLVGNAVRAKIVKNKVSAPFKEALFDIIFGYGIDKESSIFVGAKHVGVFKKTGAWYSYNDENIGRKKEIIERLKKDKAFVKKIEKETRELYLKQGSVEAIREKSEEQEEE